MHSKKIALVVASAAILLAAPAAFAFPQDAPRPPHHMMAAPGKAVPPISAEKRAEISKMREDYRNAITPLREKIMQKNMELRSLAPNPNVKPEELKALVAEIIALRKDVQKLNDEFKAKMPQRPGMPAKAGAAQKGFPMQKMQQGRQNGCPRMMMNAHNAKGECPRAGHAKMDDFRNGHAMQGKCPRR